MNGFFQLVPNQNGTGLAIYPPTEGGVPLDINEVSAYLKKKGIPFDITQVNMGIRNAIAPTVIMINQQPGVMEPEDMEIRISPDGMTAVARFYPPSQGVFVMSKQDIMNAVSQQKIRYGIREDAIDSFVAKREYCKDILIAEGKAPRQGKDAVIEYYFNTDLKVRPTLNEDGSVDFFHLNTINHCKKGDILAKLIKEDPGDNGISVFGNPIKPRSVESKHLEFSNHISASPDRTVLTSEVNGHVCMVKDMIFVSNVFEIENVDNSVGDIEYEGSVTINGNVCSNFTVVAHGDVEIKGIVEGAYIKADGDIIIARGMNGMSRGKLEAGGNVIAKFIENATVEAGGYVEAGAILHSNVTAGTEINVVSRKGYITGGKISAANGVNVKNLGSSMAADTIVEIGVDPSKKQRILALQKELALINKELQQIEPILANTRQKLARGENIPPDRVKYVQILMQAEKQKRQRQKECMEEVSALEGALQANKSASVVVTGEVYGGTKIIIADSALTVQNTVKYCRFIRMDGEVKMTSI